jgi:hypothetical protein
VVRDKWFAQNVSADKSPAPRDRVLDMVENSADPIMRIKEWPLGSNWQRTGRAKDE